MRFFLFGLVAFLIALRGFVRVRRTGNPWVATPHVVLASSIDMVNGILMHAWPVATAFAAVLVIAIWLWWNRGGGKRRMKKWLRKFKPVRRTAPQPS